MESILYVPGHRQSYIDKALTLNSTALTLDIEDSVPPSEKTNARNNIANYLELMPYFDIPIYARVNPFKSGLLDCDLYMVVKHSLTGICLPKVSSLEEIKYLDGKLSMLEYTRDIDQYSIKIQLLIETPRAIMDISKLVNSSSRIDSLVFGVVDYCSYMGIQLKQPNGLEYLFARNTVVNAAISIGAIPIDSPYMNMEDEDGFIEDCKFSKSLGYKGRVIINPKQIDIANEVYSDNIDRIEWAKEVVEVFEKEALSKGLAAITHKGKMIATAVYNDAKNILSEVTK